MDATPKDTNSKQVKCEGAETGHLQFIPQYGVVHLSDALSPEEQRSLYKVVEPSCKWAGCSPTICLSSGAQGSDTRNEALHTLGEVLYQRVALGCTQQINEDTGRSRGLQRLERVQSGEEPASIHHVSGVCYKSVDTLNNHTDCPKPLFTLSVALGDTCDFTVGKKTARPHKNETSGDPVTIRMASGDALFFDAGSVPHSIDRIVPNTAPEWWKQAKPGGARVSLLFREPDF